ncbi:MAG: hypothetical protein R3325_09700 [Thermoanaerobaculia bacterium]|nr:hypothetical protein [Thermoanaerobaculia bacterium]
MLRRALLPLLLLPLVACGASGEADLADRDELRAVIEAYLPRLGAAYADGDLAGLEGYAAPKEIASVRKRIDDLTAEGRSLVPTLKQFSIESWDVWSHSNAYVTTVEVWDLEVFSTGTRRLLASEIGQRSRVKYQMKRDSDSAAGWLVLYRTIVE